MKLKVIHDFASDRLKLVGQCKSCEQSQFWEEHGNTHWDCSHDSFEKLPETTGKLSWGEKGCPCPLWQPLASKWCEKHGLYFEKHGCGMCECEFYEKNINR